MPQARAYSTMDVMGDKLVIFGGKQGDISFNDIHWLDLTVEGLRLH